MKHLLKYFASGGPSRAISEEAKGSGEASSPTLPHSSRDGGRGAADSQHYSHREIAGFSRRDFLVGTGMALLALQGAGRVVHAQEGTPIKIGLMLPQSGPLAGEAKSLMAGFDLCMMERAPGKKPKVIKHDPGADEQQIAACVTALVINQKVDFLVGPLSLEAVEKTILGVTGASTVMFVANASVRLVGGELCRPNTFSVTANTYQSSQPLASWAMKNIGQKLFITGEDETCCNEEGDFFAYSFERAGGTFLDRVMVPAGNSKGIDGIINTLSRIKPDIIFAAFRNDSAVTFLKALRAASPPISCPVIGPDHLTSFARGLTAMGSAGAGVKTLTYLKGPGELVSRIKAKLGREVPNAARAAEGYDMAAVICAAIANLKGGSIVFSRVLQFIGGMQLEGARGKLSFDKNHQPIMEGYVQEWNLAGGSWKQNIVTSIGECRSPDFGCGRIGFPGEPAKGTWQEPDLLDEA